MNIGFVQYSTGELVENLLSRHGKGALDVIPELTGGEEGVETGVKVITDKIKCGGGGGTVKKTV